MKTIVITGATSGIGLATARLLAGQGYRVIGVGRRAEACADAQASIKAVHPQANLRFYTADLMQRSQVLRLAEAIQNNLAQFSGGALHALINNAGCVRSWYMTTEEGYEQQFALNHLAGYLLTHALLPCLQKGAGLVIMTGSQSHRGARVHWNDVMLRHRYGSPHRLQAIQIMQPTFRQRTQRPLCRLGHPYLCGRSRAGAYGYRG